MFALIMVVQDGTRFETNIAYFALVKMVRNTSLFFVVVGDVHGKGGVVFPLSVFLVYVPVAKRTFLSVYHLDAMSCGFFTRIIFAVNRKRHLGFVLGFVAGFVAGFGRSLKPNGL